MKRLIDEDHEANSPRELLASLVHASRSREPPAIDPQRMLRSIMARPPSSPFGAAGLGSAAAALSVAAVAAASIGAIVTATVRHRTPTGDATAEIAFVDSATPAEDELAEAPLPPVVALPSAAPTATEATPPSSRSADAPSVRLRSPAKAGALHDGEDPAPVLAAIRALREDGDAARAGELLAGYLRAHPRGVLAEDALALSIEAAAARHDGRAASDLARRYLAQFPRGRYRAFAERAGH